MQAHNDVGLHVVCTCHVSRPKPESADYYVKDRKGIRLTAIGHLTESRSSPSTPHVTLLHPLRSVTRKFRQSSDRVVDSWYDCGACTGSRLVRLLAPAPIAVSIDACHAMQQHRPTSYMLTECTSIWYQLKTRAVIQKPSSQVKRVAWLTSTPINGWGKLLLLPICGCMYVCMYRPRCSFHGLLSTRLPSVRQ